MFADPSHHCFCTLPAYQSPGRIIHTPLSLSPTGDASSQNIVYLWLCQNKNPQRERGGAGWVMTQGVYIALYRVQPYFFFFFLQDGCGFWNTCLDFWELPFFLYSLLKKKNRNWSIDCHVIMIYWVLLTQWCFGRSFGTCLSSEGGGKRVVSLLVSFRSQRGAQTASARCLVSPLPQRRSALWAPCVKITTKATAPSASREVQCMH